MKKFHHKLKTISLYVSRKNKLSYSLYLKQIWQQNQKISNRFVTKAIQMSRFDVLNNINKLLVKFLGQKYLKYWYVKTSQIEILSFERKNVSKFIFESYCRIRSSYGMFDMRIENIIIITVICQAAVVVKYQNPKLQLLGSKINVLRANVEKEVFHLGQFLDMLSLSFSLDIMKAIGWVYQYVS